MARKKCYYKSLEVDNDAPIEEIKANFRRLSKETHPDVAPDGCPKRNAERFKEISEAYGILSNSKERRRYDFELQDRNWYQNRSTAGGGVDYSSHYRKTGMWRPPQDGPKATGVYAVLETMFRPRNFFMGIVMVGGASWFYQTFVADDTQRKLMRTHGTTQLVEAWKNPKSGRWEQAAPWDPTYRALKPTLTLVPREQVQTRTR